MPFFRRLKPLRNAAGEIVCTFPASMSGGVLDDAGRHIPNTPGFDLDRLIEVHPYKSVLGPYLPIEVGVVWMVKPQDPCSIPDFAMEGMRQEAHNGRGLLLLSFNRDDRDKARIFLLKTLRWRVAAATADRLGLSGLLEVPP